MVDTHVRTWGENHRAFCLYANPVKTTIRIMERMIFDIMGSSPIGIPNK